MSLKERLGKQPIFLLEIDWNGQLYRVASDACDVPSDSGLIPFTGSLLEFDYQESMSIGSTQLDTNVLGCSIILDGVDILLEFALGNGIQGSCAEFSYVMFDGRSVSAYEERIILTKGIIQEPQYGDPLEPEDFLAISISAEPFDESRLLIDPELRIDERWADRDIETADGKAYPIVFGEPGQINQADGTTTQVFSVPAYCISDDHSSLNGIRALIGAGRLIQGPSVLGSGLDVTIKDQIGNTLLKPIRTSVDSRGNYYSYIQILNTDVLAFPGCNAFAGENASEYYVSCIGGIQSPYQDSVLQGGGDICRWALEKTGQLVDHAAWANMSAILNRYSFAGYVNDPTIGAWDWLSGNILPYLPISIVGGPNGIKPVLIQLWALELIHPVGIVSIGVAEDWLQISAVETIRSTGDLINRSVVKYAPKGFDDDESQQVVCTAVPLQDGEIGSDYAVISQQRYGIQEQGVTTEYVYSRATADRIAMDIVRANALPIKQFTVVAGFEWGWLELGDCVEVTNSRLHLFSHKMLVVSKRWNGQAFEFTLMFEDNHIQNPRQ